MVKREKAETSEEEELDRQIEERLSKYGDDKLSILTGIYGNQLLGKHARPFEGDIIKLAREAIRA